MSNASPSVIGRRVSGWSPRQISRNLVSLIFPLMFVASLWWGWHLIRGFGHLLDDDHTVATIAGTLFFGCLFVVGLAATLFLVIPALRNPMIESACPCCGK